jgi:hypothetical protein
MKPIVITVLIGVYWQIQLVLAPPPASSENCRCSGVLQDKVHSDDKISVSLGEQNILSGRFVSIAGQTLKIKTYDAGVSRFFEKQVEISEASLIEFKNVGLRCSRGGCELLSGKVLVRTRGLSFLGSSRGSEAFEGRLNGSSGDSLRLDQGNRVPVLIPFESITDIALSGGVSRRTGQVVGTLLGLGLGLGVAAIADDDSSYDVDFSGLGFVLGGGALGFLVGSFYTDESWKPVTLQDGGVFIVPPDRNSGTAP